MRQIVITLLLYLWIQPLMAQDAGSRMLNIPGWTGVITQDPFTDEWVTGAAVAKVGNDRSVLVNCTPDLNDKSRNFGAFGGEQIHFANLEMSLPMPKLPSGPADVEFRIGKQKTQTGKWRITTGGKASGLKVPEELIEEVLRSGRIAVRIFGNTREFSWRNGEDVYAIMSECAGIESEKTYKF